MLRELALRWKAANPAETRHATAIAIGLSPLRFYRMLRDPEFGEAWQLLEMSHEARVRVRKEGIEEAVLGVLEGIATGKEGETGGKEDKPKVKDRIDAANKLLVHIRQTDKDKGIQSNEGMRILLQTFIEAGQRWIAQEGNTESRAGASQLEAGIIEGDIVGPPHGR
jgi:hypothetical protein